MRDVCFWYRRGSNNETGLEIAAPCASAPVDHTDGAGGVMPRIGDWRFGFHLFLGIRPVPFGRRAADHLCRAPVPHRDAGTVSHSPRGYPEGREDCPPPTAKIHTVGGKREGAAGHAPQQACRRPGGRHGDAVYFGYRSTL